MSEDMTERDLFRMLKVFANPLMKAFRDEWQNEVLSRKSTNKIDVELVAKQSDQINNLRTRIPPPPPPSVDESQEYESQSEFSEAAKPKRLQAHIASSQRAKSSGTSKIKQENTIIRTEVEQMQHPKATSHTMNDMKRQKEIRHEIWASAGLMETSDTETSLGVNGRKRRRSIGEDDWTLDGLGEISDTESEDEFSEDTENDADSDSTQSSGSTHSSISVNQRTHKTIPQVVITKTLEDTRTTPSNARSRPSMESTLGTKPSAKAKERPPTQSTIKPPTSTGAAKEATSDKNRLSTSQARQKGVVRVTYGPDRTILNEAASHERTDEEITREFYEPTDEENTQAAIQCNKLVEGVLLEEAPKKADLWKYIHQQHKLPVPEKTYLRHEWPEKDHILHYLRKRLSTIPVETVEDENVTMEIMTAHNYRALVEPPIPKRTITSSVHFKDRNGESLMIKINTGMEEPFEGHSSGSMKAHILQAMDRIEARGVTAPPPCNVDNRHPTNNFRIAKDYWSKKGKPCGVFHFACWRAKGRAHDKWWESAGPFNHVLSKDVLGTRAFEFGARVRFLQDMAPVQQAMSLWFEAIDEPRYKIYRQQFEHMVDADTGLSAVRFSNNQSFLGLASLRNVQVHNHKDKGDVRDGWVGMTCVGAFTGGELCLPDLDVKLRFLPGDVVFFRSCVLQHFVRATVGERSSLVFFSHSSPETTTQNARYMEEGSEEHVQAVRERKVISEMKTAAKARDVAARAKSELPPYPTKPEDLTEMKLRKARMRKGRFLRFAKAEYKAGDVSKEEVTRIEETPAAAFYELTLPELKRYEKGKYPFAPVNKRVKNH